MGTLVEQASPLSPIAGFTPAQRRRAVLAATVGNGLEFYDFITFAFFAIQIGNTFFPSVDPFLSLMGSLATFWAGFLTRPLGALILGGFADRRGRKPAMLLSMSLMGAGIVLLCVTPGYATIGIAAPIVAVLARMLQGFALGGEVGSATVYLMESAKPERRGWTTSWQGGSQQIAATLGALVGLVISLFLTPAELSAYGWRIALALGASIVPAALWVRHSLPETFDAPKAAPVRRPSVRSYLRPVVCGFIIIASGTIGTYIFNYMATFGQNTLNLSPAVSQGGEFASNGAAFFAVMAGGWLSDRLGRRPIQVWGQLAFAALTVPCFLWLVEGHDAVSFVGANLVLGAVGSFVNGATYAAISESVPAEVRSRTFALVYSLPVAIFGGSTQLFVTWLLHVTGSSMAPAWYLTGATLVGLVAMLAMRESAPVKIGAAPAAA
jgi:MHS family citrate/tricarballylate:H+ symporter-like MFS transporter